MGKITDKKYYLLLNRDLEIERKITGKELRTKYGITNINKVMNSPQDMIIDGCILVEDEKSDYDEISRFYEDSKYEYYITDNADTFRVCKTTRKRDKVTVIKRKNNRGLSIRINRKERKLEQIMVECFAINLPENYRIIFRDNNKYNCSLDNLIVHEIRHDRKETKHIFSTKKQENEYKSKITEQEFIMFDKGKLYEYYVNRKAEIYRKNISTGRIFPLNPFRKNNIMVVKINSKERNLSHIVIDTFLKPEYRYIVQYRDNDPQNCSLDNLEIISKSSHAGNTIAKIPPVNRRKVGIYDNDRCIKEFDSILDACLYLDIEYSYARSIVSLQKQNNLYGLRYIQH